MSLPDRTVTVRDTTCRADDEAPCLFFVMSGDMPSDVPSRHSLAGIYEATIGRGERRATRDDHVLALTHPDKQMSRAHVALRRLSGVWALNDTSKNGTLVNGTKVSSHTLADGDVLELGHTFWLFRSAVPRAREAPPDRYASLMAPILPPGLATMSAVTATQFAKLLVAASSTLPLLITGETGTGKEVAARAVHALSKRAGQFVQVNCAALPQDLAESLLFGHKKGIFSGANTDSLGFFAASDGGTLFLDEIGALPIEQQAKVLVALDHGGRVTRVGDTAPRPVALRLVAGTLELLGDMVERGTFRHDLLERVSGFSVDLPALRERREDIGHLTATFLRACAPDRRPHLSLECARALMLHDWPGNIRSPLCQGSCRIPLAA